MRQTHECVNSHELLEEHQTNAHMRPAPAAVLEAYRISKSAFRAIRSMLLEEAQEQKIFVSFGSSYTV